jgi:predicted RNA binding protein YcfA (HicA-like mRNA interferase family)
MAETFDRELRRILREAGCTVVRPSKGSHEIWSSPITRRSFTVPVGTVSRHTASAVLKQAGLPKRF